MMSKENEKLTVDSNPDSEVEMSEESASEIEDSGPVLEGEITEDGVESGEPMETERNPGEPSLEEQYEKMKEKAEANRNDYLRSVADMQNLRKRTARDIQQARSFAIEGFARDLLSVSDNMSRAVDALADQEDAAIRSLMEGVEMVQKELNRAFEKHGLAKIVALNEPFDPNFHQAVVQIDAPDAESGQVVQEMQTGYTLNGRLLRPAMVGVAKG
ncbi:MAG: nucleotide exchange factor GrpE [Magnetococcales bacterium]|nr:nucleotide exchange factor GrpE [Magnetococcales bacterium]